MSPPVETSKEVIPETPSSLLPSLTVPAVEEQTSPRRFSALAKKPRKCARIVSSDEEYGESSFEVNGLFKHRKLSDSKSSCMHGAKMITGSRIDLCTIHCRFPTGQVSDEI